MSVVCVFSVVIVQCSGKIIKEMLGSVASGTPYTTKWQPLLKVEI